MGWSVHTSHPVERAGCFGLRSELCTCCCVGVSILCFFLMVSWVGLSTHLPVERAGCLFCGPYCIFAVMWLLLHCVSSWWFHGLVCAHISPWKVLVALFCVPNCVLAVMWLSVLCVSS